MRKPRNPSALVVSLLACLWLTSVTPRAFAATDQEGQPDWIKPAATYSSLYLVVVSAVQVARLAITAIAPAAWLMPAQMFGIPLVVMPVMLTAGPGLRQFVPQAVDRLLGDS